MNQSKTFYLVRHGLATHSLHGYGKRKMTASILKEGIPAIKKVATALKKVGESTNISSEIIRCRETSAIITEITGKKFTYDKRLNEDNNESIGDIRKRVQDFINDAFKLPQHNIIICTHGIVIAAIKNLLINKKFVTRNILDYPTTGTLVIIEGNETKI